MKKTATLLLILFVVLNLIACGFRIPKPTQGNGEAPVTPQETTAGTHTESVVTDPTAPVTNIPEVAPAETTAPEAALSREITLEQFLGLMKGIWIYDDTVERLSEDVIVFTALIVEEDHCAIGWYPGEIDRPGRYRGFTQIDQNTYTAELLYEAGMHMGEYYEQSRSTVTFVLTGEGRMKVKFDGNQYYSVTCGGSTFEQASAVADSMVP